MDGPRFIAKIEAPGTVLTSFCESMRGSVIKRVAVGPGHSLPLVARRGGENAAEYFGAILNFVGVTAVPVEKIYFRAFAHVKGEAAFIQLGIAIEQHIVVPAWRRAAGMKRLQTFDRRAIPNTSDGRDRIGIRREILGGQGACRFDVGIGVEVGPVP
jgi:hypothetical protein